MLISSRQKQIKDKEHFIAVQARHDRDEFNRVTKSVVVVVVVVVVFVVVVVVLALIFDPGLFMDSRALLY